MCQRLSQTPSTCQTFCMLFCLIIQSRRDSPFQNEVISVSPGYLTTPMPRCGMNAHHWRYMEWQVKPGTELQIQPHKSCCMTVKSTASCQFLFLTWHSTDSKWMPTGLRQFSTLSVQDVFKTDGRSAEYLLPIRQRSCKNGISEGKEKCTVFLIH